MCHEAKILNALNTWIDEGGQTSAIGILVEYLCDDEYWTADHMSDESLESLKRLIKYIEDRNESSIRTYN